MLVAAKMGKKHAKCNGKGDFGSGSCTGASASPVGSPPPLPPLHHSRTNSTRPSPSVPGTPLSSSFTFDYDSDFPPVSQLNSPPDSEYRSRRSSSFTGSESTARLAEIERVNIEQELRGRLVDIHRKNKPPKNRKFRDHVQARADDATVVELLTRSRSGST